MSCRHVGMLAGIVAMLLTPAAGLAQNTQSVPPAARAATRVSPAPMAPATVVPTERSRALALELATLLNTEAMLKQQLDRSYEEILPAMLVARPDFQEMEAAYPGIIQVTVDAERKVVVGHAFDHLHRAQAYMGDLYAERFTEAELAKILAYYHSPTGQRILSAIAAGYDLSAIITKNIDSFGEAQLEGGDLLKATIPASLKFLSEMTPQKRREITAFMLTPEARKWTVAQSEIMQLVAAHANDMNKPVMEEAQKAVMEDVMDFIAALAAAAPETKKSDANDQ
tara:strand:- start:518 stop:1366 length:849 start_codon:yes stop_codon:yes gene_type:complete